MQVKPIHTEEEYIAALRMVEPYFDNEPVVGSEEGDRFEMLIMVIDAYEAKHHSIASPDPIEAIKFRMEQSGLTASDLVPMIGQLNRVYEILNKRRPLTLPMIRRLHTDLGIPAESLINEISTPKLAKRQLAHSH